MAPAAPRQDRELTVHLYGKTADLIRAESANRDMSPDRMVTQIIWAWFTDLERDRRGLDAAQIVPQPGGVAVVLTAEGRPKPSH